MMPPEYRDATQAERAARIRELIAEKRAMEEAGLTPIDWLGVVGVLCALLCIAILVVGGAYFILQIVGVI